MHVTDVHVTDCSDSFYIHVTYYSDSLYACDSATL